MFECLFCGEKWHDKGYVFVNIDAAYWHSEKNLWTSDGKIDVKRNTGNRQKLPKDWFELSERPNST